MKQYSDAEARQHLAAVLEQAQRDGSVRIQCHDGKSFILTPEPRFKSPLDIPGITPANPITRDDIIQSIHEARSAR